MTSTKIKSAAALLMQSAGLGAKSITDPEAGMDFSLVMGQTVSKESMDLTSNSGKGQLADISTQATAPIKVDKTMTAANLQKEGAKTGLKRSSDNQPKDGAAVRDVISKGAAKEAEQNINESVEIKADEAIAGTADGSGEMAVTDTMNAMEEEQEIDPMIMEAISTAIQTIKDEIVTALGITEEELVKALGALGLTETDLLDSANIKALTARLMGDGDALSIVTKEGLFETVGQLTEMVDTTVNSLMEEISPKADKAILGGLLEAYNKANEPAPEIINTDNAQQNAIPVQTVSGTQQDIPVGTDVSQITGNGPVVDTSVNTVTDGTLQQASQTEAVQNTETQNADTKLPVWDDIQTVTTVVNTPVTEPEEIDPDHIMEDPLQDVSLTDSRTQQSDIKEAPVKEAIASGQAPEFKEVVIEEPVQSITGEAIKEATVVPAKEEQGTGDSSSGSGRKGSQKSSTKETTFDPAKEDSSQAALKSGDISSGIKAFTESIRPDGTMPVSQPQEAPLPQAGVDAYDILRQINQNLNADLAREVSEIHLKLNPETLGNLHIHITSKAGTITAQFIAENEAVKNALSTQAVTLRENLESQGLKVEAVEVTIAGQQLNRSYQQNGEGQGRFEEPKKNKTRRLQLSGDTTVEDLDGMDISEDDRLTAEMMAINGNTINYLA